MFERENKADVLATKAQYDQNVAYGMDWFTSHSLRDPGYILKFSELLLDENGNDLLQAAQDCEMTRIIVRNCCALGFTDLMLRIQEREAEDGQV